MALQNREELHALLAGDVRLGWVFARHAYGMRAWVDLFAGRRDDIADPALAALVGRIVLDNARHALLFAERARAHGIDAGAYVCPPEGEAIYTRLDALRDPDEVVGYALGSLDHFEELLSVYAGVAEWPEDVAVIAEVRADTAAARAALRGMAGPRAAALADEAHELYRLREIAETPLYADRESAALTEGA
jgi:hypothetical protein